MNTRTTITPFTLSELYEWMEYYERGGELDDETMCQLFQTALVGLQHECHPPISQ